VFCRRQTDHLAISHRKDLEGRIYSGALCKGCIRSFILDMAYVEPDEFESLVAEARGERRGD